MSKPNWKDAPEWANYVAMDADGYWYWYENEPTKNYDDQWEPPSGRVEEASFPADIWFDTLEPRPE